MERLDKPEAGNKSANITFHSDKTSGNIVLTVENAAIGYDGEILSEPINLDLRKMNAVAVVGPNGIGKTTFIKSIVDQIPFIKERSGLVPMSKLATMIKHKANLHQVIVF